MKLYNCIKCGEQPQETTWIIQHGEVRESKNAIAPRPVNIGWFIEWEIHNASEETQYQIFCTCPKRKVVSKSQVNAIEKWNKLNMEPLPRTCGLCRYFKDSECWRYPPNYEKKTPWPVVLDYYFCGEFESNV